MSKNSTSEKVIIFSAPSGAGKTTIVKSILAEFPSLEFSVSATSRTPREGETHGKDYYFLSADNFREKIQNLEFLEWEEVYANSFYGTLKSEPERIWEKGNQVIFDVDVMGGINIKKLFTQKALSIFVMPPSLEILEQRLINRGTETPESLKKRLDKAAHEMSFANEFDKIVINDHLETAIAETIALIKEFLDKDIEE